ncbi:LexA repressor [Ectothiorhodospira haloalkaliphila]|uniref:LexA repressor n=1 Tax=Ectothiorhodospira haloalkaliphila TaxID=421628 RepID=W8KJM5_9GAMM|nr:MULTISPECIES: transcriptional repressor LexA [Ectothiorhodospira]AHK79373.1 LexA repressor [Ectothiorhodospira haloalkaliphila]MCG5494874.1 transcriptional repressor LexA [Ectothiorhodospira variabilis]MCG5497721.1 transcriptional repressor LexA [Ectothiorhodospira variabilis]MCG5504387.1 transcriptional repressor LexA [Ectothiorhodospira variabilis]MCG5507542.1 transcriptional repressor LexA [Ectothiorhodospira variabilis]
MEKLTPRQAEILAFIRDYMQTSGMPPTREDIMRAFGFKSPNAAECHLRTLARKGAIDILAGTSRGIRLREPLGLPLVGRVAAGAPVLAEEHIEDHYRLDPRLFNPRPDYLLRVQGLSMIGAGIMDGDLLAVHRTPEVRNGQIAVFRLEDEVTVKRFQQEGHTVRLLPENPDFEPIVVDLRQEALNVEGVSVGIIRNQDA